MEHEEDEQSNCESDDEDTVYVLSVKDDDGYWVTPLLKNEPVRMQVDTGTRLSIGIRGCLQGEAETPCSSREQAKVVKVRVKQK